MEECIFCKIAEKKIPAHVVYEDGAFIAFLDVNPVAPGHVQVVPKKHFRWVWDIPALPDEVPNIGEYFAMVRRVALAVRKAFGTEAVHSKVMGDEVPHAHVWVYPNPKEVQGDAKDFEGNAEKIRAVME